MKSWSRKIGASMAITPAEIAETRGMVLEQHLDIRTITMGISLMAAPTRASSACARRSMIA